MKNRVLSLISVALVFLCIIGCTGGQDIDAGVITEKDESASLDSAAADESSVSEAGDALSETDVTAGEQDITASDEVLYVSTTANSTTLKASSASASASSVTTVITANAKTTLPATSSKASVTSTSKAVTTTKATTTKAVTTTKPASTTTTKSSGGAVVIDKTTTNAATTHSGGSVTLYISCKKAVDYGIRERPGYDVIIPENGILLSTTAELVSGDTVMTLLARELKSSGISLNRQSDYIRGIGGLNEKDCGATSGWLFSVNGVFPTYSTASYKLSDGDSVRILYSIVNGDVTMIYS